MSWKVLKIHKTGLIPVKKVPETHDRINRVYRKDLYRTYVGRMQDLISDSADRSENVLNREYKERLYMEIKEWNGSQNDLMRIIQESVPGKQITMAHIISSPDPVIYKKLGLDPRIDYKKAAIGVLTQTPSETAIITADLALKAAAIEIGFIDRFSGTLIITGTISDVAIAFEKILEYTKRELGFTVCPITKA